MKRVIVRYDDRVEFFENVTKIQCFLAFDCFNNYIVIYQGKNKTKIKECDINGFEVVSE